VDLVTSLDMATRQVSQMQFELAKLIRARQLLKLRRTLAYDIGTTEKRYQDMIHLSVSRLVANGRALSAEMLGVLYDLERSSPSSW